MTDQIYNARMLSTAWLSVALAAGKVAEIPVLNRTILVEQYSQGLRLIATDRYVLLRSFVPNVDHKPDDEPSLDEAPDEFAVAMDLDGRARGLLGYLLGIAKYAAKEGLDPVEVRVSLNATDDQDDPTFQGMERRYVRFDYEAQERLQLDTYGGDFPEWRSLTTTIEHQTTDAIALNPEIIGRLARLGKLHNNSPIAWRFGGESKAAEIEIVGSEPDVRGIVMPVRMEFGEDTASAS